MTYLPEGPLPASREAGTKSRYCMETGEKSWNQFFACTKPFTFGLIARGPVSCTQKRKNDSSTARSCSLASAASRCFASKL